MKKKIFIIGGGAAGMMCAAVLSENGMDTELFEKNEKLGKKLFITGKGRCNLTNSSDMDNVMQNIVTNRKFMYSSLNGFSNNDTIDFFRDHGLSLKTERGNRVFPVSDHSSDVIGTLADILKKNGTGIHLNTEVKNIYTEDGLCRGITLEDGRKKMCDRVIVATGGLSYSSTGSTGDGYRFASDNDIAVTETTPSLVPMNIRENICRELQGLSLKNTGIKIFKEKKELYTDFGEMLFTHFGVSGPMIISASGSIPYHEFDNGLRLVIDLKPALTEEQLDKRMQRDFISSENKEFKNSVSALFPAKLVPVMIGLSGILPEKKINSVTKEERLRFVHLIKNMELTITGLRGFDEAIITKGGISIKEINPKTFESKRIKGLSFIGEVLDVDALTGGYNLQIAWSSAVMCARAQIDSTY